VNPWASTSSWQGDGVRRQLFFVSSGADRVYASLYAATNPQLDLRLLICPGWGFDMFQFNDLMHSMALGVARLGGAAALFHPPGHGDSTGDMAQLTVPRNVEVVQDLAAEVDTLVPGAGWGLAGIRIGASVAALSAEALGGDLLALIEPALDLPSHFEEVERRAKRLSLGRGGEPSLFGHPLTRRAAEELPQTTPANVLTGFAGLAAIIGYGDPQAPSGAGQVSRVAVPGKLSNPAKLEEQKALASATVTWIRSAVQARITS
jgi:pimeloyl-ACP methyl ester carboxylesterase